MNDTSLKAVCVKATTAAGLFAAAWMFTVKPATANLDDRRNLLDAQSIAVSEFTERTRTADTTALALDRINTHAKDFAERLTRHPTDAGIYDAIEAAASTHRVSVHRTEPRAVPRRSRAAGRTAPTADSSGVTVAVFTIELTGTYGSVVAFLDTVSETLGLVRVVDIQLTASTGDNVRGVIGLAAYRVPPDAIIIPDLQEAGEDDA